MKTTISKSLRDIETNHRPASVLRPITAFAAALALAFGSENAFSRPLGVDVSSYQPGITWSSVKGAGYTFAWAKATEGTYGQDTTFTYNESNGKAAGVDIGAYHFARPDLDSPDSEANYFWNFAGSYVKGDGLTLMPMLDMETFNGVVGASTYAGWVNQWCGDIVGDASRGGVTVKPVLYTTTCEACNLDSSVAQWIPWIANPSGESAQTGSPWDFTSCDSCDFWNGWTVWQFDWNGSVPGISSVVDRDVINGSSIPSSLLAAAALVEHDYTGILLSDGTVLIKDGVGGVWNNEFNPASSFQMYSNRIAVLKTDGTLYCKDGLGTTWSSEFAPTTAYQINGNRLGVINNSSTFFAKDGLGATWDNEFTPATSFQLNSNRLAVLSGNTLYCKDGLSATWSSEFSPATAYQINGNRLGVINNSGTFFAKDGLGAQWSNEFTPATSFQLDGNRLAVLSGNTLYCKDGLGATWSSEFSPAAAYQIQGNRIAVLDTSGTLNCKDGLGSTWSSEATGVTAFALDGNRIAVVANGTLYIKYGLNGLWNSEYTGLTIVSIQLATAWLPQ